MAKFMTAVTVQVEVEADTLVKGEGVINDWIDRIAKYDDYAVVPIWWDDITWTPLEQSE